MIAMLPSSRTSMVSVVPAAVSTDCPSRKTTTGESSTGPTTTWPSRSCSISSTVKLFSRRLTTASSLRTFPGSSGVATNASSFGRNAVSSTVGSSRIPTGESGLASRTRSTCASRMS